MKTKSLLILLLFPLLCQAQDSLRYNQLSLGFNFASILNVSPELNAEYLLTEKLSTKIDIGFRPKIGTLDMSRNLDHRKVGGYFSRLGIRFYNRTHTRKKNFYSGAGVIFAYYDSKADVVVRDYFNKFYYPLSSKQYTYGLTGNLGFQRKFGTKFLFELGGAYNFLFNLEDQILNEYAYLSTAQPGLGNVSISAHSSKISNGISLNISLRYILYYRNDKLNYESSDYAK